METEEALLLESEIFSILSTNWPSVCVEIMIVHFDKWLSVCIFMPTDDISEDSFVRVAEITDRLIDNTRFKGLVCRHKNSICKPGGDYCYNFWLPISPERDKKAFDRFF